MTIRTGIVGYGSMGTWHAEQVRKQSGFVLHSVYDSTPARREVAKKLGRVGVHSDLKSFLSDDHLDLVIVATPSHAHTGPAIAALDAGKNVIVEKPMCTSAQDAQRMIEAAQRNKRTLSTFQNRRWDQSFRTTEKVVESGRLGQLYDIRCVSWGYTRLMQTYGVKEFRPQWRSEARYGGGVLFDFGAHSLDQLLVLCPQKIVDVYGDLRGRRWTEDADDQFLAVVRFEDGVVAQVEHSQNSLVDYGTSWTINAAKAGYRFVDGHGEIHTRSRTGQEKVTSVKPLPDAWGEYYKNYRSHLEDGTTLAVPPAESLRLMRLLDAVRTSSATGQVVPLNDR
jgi:scyllo-inositol 2-dehydrogenase (NADP+)